MKAWRLLFLLPFCLGCLWDRDTLAEESKEDMDTLRIIVGWFDRYPPEYYQMRLDRVLEKLEEDPENLDLYDDAAVALDRRYRSPEAIAMMERKKQAMASLEGTPQADDLEEHRYRYLANLGTFHAHDWVRRPKEVRDSDLTSLQKAEKLIAAAIELNPDSHFGREKYQLMAIRWLQKTPDDPEFELNLAGPMGPDVRKFPEFQVDEALEGFLGMIKLGSAWESIDLFQVVQELLSAQTRRTLGKVAEFRIEELEKMGRTSLHPHAELIAYRSWGGPEPAIRKDLEQWYSRVRKAADEREESRWTYLREGIAEGRHPDTDPSFWNDWKEPKFPTLPGERLRDYYSFTYHPVIAFSLIVILPLTLLWLLSFLRRKRTLRESLDTLGPGSLTSFSEPKG